MRVITRQRNNTGNFADLYPTVDTDPRPLLGVAIRIHNPLLGVVIRVIIRSRIHIINHRHYHMQTGLLVLRIDSCTAASNTKVPADMTDAAVVPEDILGLLGLLA